MSDHSNGNPEISNSLPVLNIANRVEDVIGRMQFTKNGRISNRCMLPIVNTVVKGNNIRVNAITLIDNGSELDIMNTKLCNELGLVGTPIKVNIVGAGGETL